MMIPRIQCMLLLVVLAWKPNSEAFFVVHNNNDAIRGHTREWKQQQRSPRQRSPNRLHAHNHLRRSSLSRPQENTASSSSASSSIIQSATKESSFFSDTIQPIFLFIVYCAAAALLLLSWEDYTCSYTLPSRHRTSLHQTSSSSSYNNNNYYWGASTIRGMGFGKTERLQLYQESDDDPMSSRPSYNEIMLQHRQERVTRWKNSNTAADKQQVQKAIHTLVQCLQTVWKLQELSQDYQWNEIQKYLHAKPLSDLEMAASTLRVAVTNQDTDDAANDQNIIIIGFDWGSCAWRHCGALADAQEALDELESLLGVLEPFEAVFCLDVVERSLRDMLTTVDWQQQQQADEQDAKFWNNQLPAYVSRVSANDNDAGDPDAGESRIDDEYFKALQELRIE